MKSVIVVGAGLSGLTCARTLQRMGIEASVYEASDGVGGRVRTDVVDGFQLDRGFQVMFTAYPALREELDFPALNLCHFEPGAMIFRNGSRNILSDPKRVPGRLLSGAFSPLLGLSDKIRVPLLTLKLARLSVEEIFKLPDCTMAQFLTDFGFSQNFLDRFIRPFYGGIFLENGLQTSARMFAFVFKMLSEGETSVPAKGMGELGKQLAANLETPNAQYLTPNAQPQTPNAQRQPPNSLFLNSPVRELLKSGERVTGVRLEGGEAIEADAVVLATEADVAAKLAGFHFEVTWRVSTELAFSLPEPLFTEKLIALFSDKDSLVNDAAMISNVAPSYAPPGKHLLSATILGTPGLDEAELVSQVKRQFTVQFPACRPDSWELLRIYTVQKAQFAQPVGVWESLPTSKTQTPGLFLAGEYLSSSSLNGALAAGSFAARAVVAWE